MPAAVAVIEFSHLTKACASVPQMPMAGWSARGSQVLSGRGAWVSARKSQYRSAGTGRAQILVPAAVVRVWRVSRVAATPAISRRCSAEQSGSNACRRSRSGASAETDSPEVGEEKQRRLLGQPEKISERLPCLPQAGGPGAFRTSVLARACVEAARFGGVPANRHVAPTPTAGFRSINE